jgi:hypothetical protein
MLIDFLILDLLDKVVGLVLQSLSEEFILTPLPVLELFDVERDTLPNGQVRMALHEVYDLALAA